MAGIPSDSLRVLVVDDDRVIGDELRRYLAGFGMHVDVALDALQMRRQLLAARYDAVLLDLMLPGDDGLSLCREIKHEWPDLPVIMLTAQGDPASRVVGLELGADDYVAKPFDPRELVARIKAVLRRGAALAARARLAVAFGRWRFDRMRRQLLAADGTVVSLSGLETRLLNTFIDNPGRVLSRDRLLDASHAPGADVTDRSIDLAISRLRAKLGENGRGTSVIRTIRGEGYLFDCEVA